MEIHIKDFLDEVRTYLESCGLSDLLIDDLPEYQPRGTFLQDLKFTLPRYNRSYEIACRLRFELQPRLTDRHMGETKNGMVIKRMHYEYEYPDFVQLKLVHFDDNLRTQQLYLDLCQQVADFGQKVQYILEPGVVRSLYDEYLENPKPQKPRQYDRFAAQPDSEVKDLLMGKKKEELKSLCREFNTKVTGNKPELSVRIVKRCNEVGHPERVRKYEEWEDEEPKSIFDEEGNVAYREK